MAKQTSNPRGKGTPGAAAQPASSSGASAASAPGAKTATGAMGAIGALSAGGAVGAVGTGGAEDAIAMLQSDHRAVEALFERYENASPTHEKQQLSREVCIQLNVHTALEEELFYPACREHGVQHEALDEAQVEHDGAKVLISELMEGSPQDEFYDAKLRVLAEYIRHHVREEEKPQEGIFARAQQAGVDAVELGQRLRHRKAALLGELQTSPHELPQLRALGVIRIGQQAQETPMNRYSERHRDERGRFEDEDRPRYRGGEHREEYERRGESGYGRQSQGRGWYGDPEGHSRASEEGWEHRGGRGEPRGEWRGESRGGYRGRSEQDEGERDVGGGHRGWYGDSEGHARAAEEGWERREGGGRSHSQGDYRTRRDEDDDEQRGSGRGRGWYGDPEAHARASEEGWEHRGEGGRGEGRRGEGGYRSRRDEDDERESGSGRGRSGWYGDAEGHSRASERGWEQREHGGGSAGSRGYASRSSRYEEDDDRQSSSGRGWYGDPEGHSRASEEGWRHRGGGSRGSSRH